MPDLGKKYECYSCSTKFYDLGRPDPICPKCGANQKQAATSDAEQERLAARKRRKDDFKAVEDDEAAVDDMVAAPEFDDEIEAPEDLVVEEPEEDFDEEP
jgi:uncharacterized protein (TIGR02300 family)